VGDHGSKMFITNGTIAKYMNVFCLTDPDHKDRHQRHSFFLWRRTGKGFRPISSMENCIRPMTRQKFLFRM